MRLTYIATLVALCISSSLFAQIPNPGFENWANGDPVGWTTFDFLGDAVTQSSDSHSGSSAAKMQIIDFFSSPLPPILISGQFGVSEKNGSLTGYFKFAPNDANQVFNVVILMSNSNGYIGAGAWETYQATSAYTQFVVPIEYLPGETPDSAYIQIAVYDSSGVGTGGVGAYAIVDDLSLGGPATAITGNNVSINSFELKQNYPNPFNPSTVISYTLPTSGEVTLKVYNVLGDEVTTLVNEEKSAGSYEVKFDASQLSSGIYFYKLQAGLFVETKKMMLIR
jgi:hypothetical protein